MTRLDDFQTRHDILAVPVLGLAIATLASVGGAIVGAVVFALGNL